MKRIYGVVAGAVLAFACLLSVQEARAESLSDLQIAELTKNRSGARVASSSSTCLNLT